MAEFSKYLSDGERLPSGEVEAAELYSEKPSVDQSKLAKMLLSIGPDEMAAMAAKLYGADNPHLALKELMQKVYERNSDKMSENERGIFEGKLAQSDEELKAEYDRIFAPQKAAFEERYGKQNIANMVDQLSSKSVEKSEVIEQAKPVGEQSLKFGLRTIERSGDFGQIDAMDDGTKYQMGLAAANSAMEPGYGGHSSYTSPTRTATVYVVDDLAQARATFNLLDKSPNSQMPFKTEEEAKNGVLRFSAYDMNTHMHHDAVIVSRDFLKQNLGKELEFMKGFEESSKNVTHYSNAGRVNMHDFLEQMKKDSELPINSLSDYEQKASLTAPLAERAGKGLQNSL